MDALGISKTQACSHGLFGGSICQLFRRVSLSYNMQTKRHSLWRVKEASNLSTLLNISTDYLGFHIYSLLLSSSIYHKKRRPNAQGLWDSYQDITHLLPRLALDEGATYNLKLAASDRKGGMEVGELASQSTVKRGHLELLQLSLSPIFIYYLLIFKLPVQLETTFIFR